MDAVRLPNSPGTLTANTSFARVKADTGGHSLSGVTTSDDADMALVTTGTTGKCCGRQAIATADPARKFDHFQTPIASLALFVHYQSWFISYHLHIAHRPNSLASTRCPQELRPPMASNPMDRHCLLQQHCQRRTRERCFSSRIKRHRSSYYLLWFITEHQDQSTHRVSHTAR